MKLNQRWRSLIYSFYVDLCEEKLRSCHDLDLARFVAVHVGHLLYHRAKQTFLMLRLVSHCNAALVYYVLGTEVVRLIFVLFELVKNLKGYFVSCVQLTCQVEVWMTETSAKARLNREPSFLERADFRCV